MSEEHSEGPATTLAAVERPTESSQQLEGVSDDPAATPVTLEKLLDYLLASKRSLAATDQVWRANNIVHSAREALVESVELRARSTFIRDGIAGQLKILWRVKTGVENIAWNCRAEFEATLRDLDDTDARLQATVDLLKSTFVEPSLRPAHDEPELQTPQQQRQQKTLHDYIDGDGVETLKSGLRDCIDRTQEAHHDLVNSMERFEQDLETVKRSLAVTFTKFGESDGLEVSLPAIMRSLETQAEEMAGLLESLVRHFDLCVTALKHTEGGGAAAENITGDLPMVIRARHDDGEGGGGGGGGGENTPVEPISDGDRHEMLAVLTKDAAELDDVVMEIRDRLVEMEAQSDDLTCQLNLQAAVHANASRAFNQLEETGARLSAYVQHGRDYSNRWGEQRQQICNRTEELDVLREFYENFLAAYDRMLLEIGRRKEMRAAADTAVRKATTKLKKLYEADLAAREAFRRDQGYFLPTGIWSGLMDPPVRFEIAAVHADGDTIPDIPRAVLEQAARRQNRRL